MDLASRLAESDRQSDSTRHPILQLLVKLTPTGVRVISVSISPRVEHLQLPSLFRGLILRQPLFCYSQRHRNVHPASCTQSIQTLGSPPGEEVTEFRRQVSERYNYSPPPSWDRRFRSHLTKHHQAPLSFSHLSTDNNHFT